MTTFHVLLLLATLLCSLVAGFLFAFAVVVMPGMRRLDDGGFIRAFQAIDGVIQNNQPLFVVVWLGSVLAVVAAGVLGLSASSGAHRALLVVAALVYILGVQVPTFVVNIPLNKRLQTLDTETMAEPERKRARDEFEPRWNKWNAIRTVFATVASTLLLLVLAGFSSAASAQNAERLDEGSRYLAEERVAVSAAPARTRPRARRAPTDGRPCPRRIMRIRAHM